MHKCTKGDDSMAKKRNIIVGQSGGPTSVINSSLAGVYKNAIERGTEYRDFWMSSILIFPHRSTQNWISNSSREHHPLFWDPAVLNFLKSMKIRLFMRESLIY